jgi:membrane protease YdiL (CAAX protease family)
LTLNRYVGKTSAFRQVASRWATHAWFELYPYAWWYGTTALLLFVVPVIVSRRTFGRGWRDFGGGRGERRAARPALIAFAPMGVLAVAAGFLPAFAAKYPLCDLARERWDAFVAYELLYGLYFFAWEFFFRGWMLRGLAADFGSRAIWIQMLPFVIVHFGKPMPEALGAMPAGLFLGWVAWRSDSFLYGWALHWAVAFVLDATVAFTLR